MCEKLGFCLLLIRVQGGIEDRLKVRRGGSIGADLGHGLCQRAKFVNGREVALRPRVLSDCCPTDGGTTQR